jgi:hypothetical protein
MVDILAIRAGGRVQEKILLGSQIASVVRGYQGDDLSRNNTILSSV